MDLLLNFSIIIGFFILLYFPFRCYELEKELSNIKNKQFLEMKKDLSSLERNLAELILSIHNTEKTVREIKGILKIKQSSDESAKL